jgi:hypothetical protein
MKAVNSEALAVLLLPPPSPFILLLNLLRSPPFCLSLLIPLLRYLEYSSSEPPHYFTDRWSQTLLKSSNRIARIKIIKSSGRSTRSKRSRSNVRNKGSRIIKNQEEEEEEKQRSIRMTRIYWIEVS